jgi:hypothetical protein
LARILPDDTDAARARGIALAELDTLDLLAAGLSDEFTVFHGVHWARADDGGSVYGEIDFLVMNRHGRVLAIEQKNGRLERVGDELVKTYASGAKSVRVQVARNIGSLRKAFAQRHPGRGLDVDHLLYCPDDRVVERLPAGIDPARVVDARDARWLPDRIQALFDRQPTPSCADAADPTDVLAFLSGQVDLVPDVDALHGLARSEFRRLSGGLATWARRLAMRPFRLRVVGTAGSGKTQLALQELAAAHERGASAMYVCFNRPLAERMRGAAPDSAFVTTFHELGTTLLRERGETVDWEADGIFDRIAAAAIEAAVALRGAFDLLIVDEGQDFDPAWAGPVVDMARRDGRAIWLEDPDQNLYRRERVALDGWVELESPVNYRSPRTVITVVEALGLTERPMQAGSGIHGFDPMLRDYADEDGLRRATEATVRELLSQGHAKTDIAVLTWHGLGRSPLHAMAELAGCPTRRFTGHYDDAGNAIHTDGELLVETVHRFKGQSADCVVIAGMDFDAWTQDVARRLFVAMTRARLKVAWVLTPAAERCVVARLQGERPVEVTARS